MANLQEVVSWDAGVYQLETSDPVLGGPGGTSNKQAQALANRTAYLKKHVDDLEGGTTAAGKANKLTTARNIALAGDVTGQTSFDGSGNISITATYKNSGVVAGTYRSVTVDAKGNVTAGSNPTTLSGYGITDAVPSSQKGAANGVATLDSGGKVPIAQIPATAIVDTFVVSTQTDMLALTAEIGDVAIRTDLNKSFILRVAGASTLANWQELLTPTDAVQSVDGQTGAVTIATATEGVKGKAQVATQEEVNAGDDDTKFVTAKKLLAWVKQDTETVFQRLKTGAALPTTNIGPIWHDDYASIMTWQEFTANGANYKGYASQLVGSLLLDTQPTPRQGYIKSGVQNLSRATYAALRAWAMHCGRMVAPGVWEAGSIQCADNADGATFRVFDVRGEFFRAWDDGRGVDTGRENFSAQKGTIVGVDWNNDNSISAPLTTSTAYDLSGFSGDTAPATSALQIQTITSALTIVKGNVDSGKAVVTRPRNTALLAVIKF